MRLGIPQIFENRGKLNRLIDKLEFSNYFYNQYLLILPVYPSLLFEFRIAFHLLLYKFHFTEYRKYYFKYLSEFGFQSIPSFKTLIYASRILQAEAVKYGVEHFRRNRGRCMGVVYWQLNDCCPL